jgi:glycosyltransferase involved in cell wall biosynthesis
VTGPAPQVSVVIPTRDRRHLLEVTLAAALSQDDVELEVVVVDDGSRDRTAERLAELQDERVRVVRHEDARGVAAARNRGIAEARGEWVAFLDDDDLWSPGKLRAQLGAARASGAGFAYCAAVAVDGSRRVTRALPFPAPAELMQRLLRQNAMPAGGSNVVVRTELVRGIGGFDERLQHLADWDLWLRLAEAARAASSPEVCVAYLEHGVNMHLSELEGIRREFAYLATKHERLGERHGVELDSAGFELWVAWAHRRSGHARRAAWIYLRSGVIHRRPTNLLRAAWMMLPGASTTPTTPSPPPEPAWLRRFRDA